MPVIVGKDDSLADTLAALNHQAVLHQVLKHSVDGVLVKDVGEDFVVSDVAVILLRVQVQSLPRLKDNIYTLELFHGPTLAFKDVGARFMARLLQYFIRQENGKGQVNVLVATSGDTGSAVANGFLGVDGIHVYVLYPKGKVSPIQECQFTTLGKNITAIEVDGVFDDCQALVKNAFMDAELNRHMKLTSANSINVARFLPQAFYYFNAFARMKAQLSNGQLSNGQLSNGKLSNSQLSNGKLSNSQLSNSQIIMCVPSGNFGNICAALFGHEMGLPFKRFIAANNANDIFYNYLQTGRYEPKPSKQTLANAMDVGDPSNFARIYDLYGKSHERITSLIGGATYSDDQIRQTMRQCYEETGYILDPHGACGYQALVDGLQPGEVGVFCETAHPAKFKEKVDDILGIDVDIPARLRAFMQGEKQSTPMTRDFADFKQYLMNQ